MKANGFLLFALSIAAVFYGAYFSRGPLERWHKRLAQDLERLKSGAARAEKSSSETADEPREL